MEMNLNQSHGQAWQRLCILRILRCTAKAMASSPGGLRFKAGTRPWLDGLAGGLPALSVASCQRGNPASQAAND